MRLTFKATTAGESGMTQFPILPRPGEDYANENGIVDEAMVRRDLADVSGIQFSSDDNRCTIAFAVEFMDRVKISYGNYMKNHPGCMTDHERKPNAAKHSSCERRMDRGMYAFVRVDVSLRSDGIRVALSYDNPRGVAGEAENFAAIIALTFADILNTIKYDLKEQNTMVSLVEGKNCEGIFSRSERRLELCRQYEEHKDCACMVNGFCSPSHPECPFFKNGACRYGKLTDDAI